MSVQYSDSPAREVPGYWLGDPASGFRWWFDAEFRAWRLAGTLYLPMFALLWLAVPILGLVVGLALLARKAATPRLPEGTYTIRGRERPAYPDALAAVLILAPVLILPPRALILPMPWWAALILAVPAVVAITKRVMPYLDNNRPVAYWLATARRIAAGPRARRDVLTMRTEVATTDEAPSGLTDYHLLGLSAEVTVKHYRPITTAVEAMQWDPRDLEKAGVVAGWLQSHEVAFHVDRDKWLVIQPDTLVRPGHYVVRNPDGTFAEFSPKGFAATYEEAS